MKKRIIFGLLSLFSVIFFFSCQPDAGILPERDITAQSELSDTSATDVKIIKDVGTIRYIGLEGGFYGIVARSGNYDPINLPREFMRDGLRVEFTAEVCDDMGSFHMWGTLIKLISMKTLNIRPQMVMDTGTIRQVGIQGNPWLIQATTATYQALNLPREFMVIGLKVNFVGIIRTDVVIIPALWPLLEILRIEKVAEPPIQVNLYEEFKLPLGRSAIVPRHEVLLTFKSVLADSRCPIGAYCFWEGEAIIVVNVKIGNVDYGDFKMSTYGRPSVINVGRYYVQFNDLYPYPTLAQEIDPAAYVGYFVIGMLTDPPETGTVQ